MQNAQTIHRKTRNHQSRSFFRKNIARRAARPSRDRKMDPFSAAGCSTFLRQSEANAIHFSIRANRRAPSSRARDDAKRIFRFERRDVNKNAFTHRATRKRERLHVVERDNQTSFLVCRSFFFSVGCAVFFFFCFGRRLLFPTRDRRGLIPFGIRTTKPLALHLKRRKKNAIVKVPSTR